jgi:hypothetical protein
MAIQQGLTNLVFFEITEDVFHHLVVSDDFTSDTRSVYVDGVLVGSCALAVESGSPDVRIGSAHDDANFFNGDISEFVVYPTALTAQQVQALYAAQFEAFPEERTDERIATLLADFGYTLTDLEEGQTTMSGINSPDPANVLEAIQTAADTEFGLFFMAGDGTATFQDRHYRLLDQTTPVATLDGTEYMMTAPETDDELIANDIRVTTSDGALPFIAQDETSIDSYGQRTLDKSIYPADENEGYDLAHYLLQLRKEPTTRFDRIFFRLGADAGLWDTILSAEISDRYTIQTPLAGDDLDVDVYLESVTHTISASAQTWDVDWSVSPAATETFWLLGVTGFSELDETTRLGY